jgi:hypothetical protein
MGRDHNIVTERNHNWLQTKQITPESVEVGLTYFVFSKIPAFNAQLPVFSMIFPLWRRSWNADPLFS